MFHDDDFDAERDFKERLKELKDPSGHNQNTLGKNLSNHEIQQRRKEVHRAIYTVDLGTVAAGAVLFQNGLHLPDGLEIGAVSIEHNGTTANIVVTEGAGGSGRTIAIVKPGFLRTVTMPVFISNVSLRLQGNVTDSGLVIVTLATHIWSPGISKLS